MLNCLFYFKENSFPFPASVARFMNFSANFTFGVLKRRGMKKKGTRNWEAAGSESHFSLKWVETECRVPRKNTLFGFPRFGKDAEVNKV